MAGRSSPRLVLSCEILARIVLLVQVCEMPFQGKAFPSWFSAGCMKTGVTA